MKICPTCQNRYDDAVKFCPHDGTVLPDPVDEFLGQRLMGQFDIRERCGQGAMGTVYQAHQSNMDRLVAIKILRQDLVRDRTVVKRFYREAKAAARLSHPNIITVHLVAETDGGLPYIVMEYLEGTDLDTLCKAEAPLSLERSVKIATQIASALAEAHSNDVIHRDLKPANIIVVEKHRSPDFVKVLDFGIAKILEGGASDESRITKSGAIFGTPYYLSPEQATGGELDARADLYSLGVILYRLITGHLPFESGSGLDILVKHVKEPPPPPRLHNPEVPPALEAAILKSLEKERSGRFESAEQMRDAITAAVGNGAVPEVGQAADPSAPWARPGAGEEPGKSKRTVFGFSSGKGDPAVVRPASPEVDPLVRAASKVVDHGKTIKTQPAGVPGVPIADRAIGKPPAAKESKRTLGPTAAAWGNPPPQTAAPVEKAKAADRPDFAVRTVAPAPAPVKAPTFDPDAGRAPAPVPRALPDDAGLDAEQRPSPVGPRTVDSSPSLVTGEHAAPTGATLAAMKAVRDRGRLFTIATTLLAVVALGVGIFFIVRDQRARNAPRKPSRGALPRVDAGVQPLPRTVTADASARRTGLPQQVGEALVKVVQRGYALRLSCEAALKPKTDLTFVLDLWLDGSDKPVSDARAVLQLSAPRRKRQLVAGKATKLPGRYVFEVRFPREGKRAAVLQITLNDGTDLTARFELAVGEPRTRPRDTTRPRVMSGYRPMYRPMHRPMDVLPRDPPDRPMHRPMDVLPRDPPDPPANPMDPD